MKTGRLGKREPVLAIDVASQHGEMTAGIDGAIIASGGVVSRFAGADTADVRGPAPRRGPLGCRAVREPPLRDADGNCGIVSAIIEDD
jgi:hypothetical protein